MPGWVWALVAVAVVIVVALVVWQGVKARRTRALQGRFGPEYDRTLERADGKREGEADLAARVKRRDELDIRPLSAAARDRYAADWQHVQARFVDAPREAVQDADALIQSVMRERGYPMDDFEQRSADVSVDHPQRGRELPCRAPARRLRRHGGPAPGDGPLPGALRRTARGRRRPVAEPRSGCRRRARNGPLT